MLPSPFQLYRKHLKAFYDDFDPIKDVILQKDDYESVILQINSPKRRNKLHFLIGFCTVFYVVLDTIAIFYRDRIFQDKRYDRIQNIPDLFTHRIFPQMFWYQADIIVIVCVLMACLTFACLWLRNLYQAKSCLYALRDEHTRQVVMLINSKGEIIPDKLAKKLIKYRQLGRQVVTYLMLSILLFIELYLSQQVFIQSLYTLPNLIFYFIYLPWMISNCVIADVVLIFFFVLTNRYIQIEQQFLLEKMIHFEKHQMKPSSNVVVMQMKWLQVKAINRQINRLCVDITHLNDFWSLYASIFFAGYLILVSYFAFSFFFLDGTWEKKAFFSIFFIHDGIFLFIVIGQSALIVDNHNKIEFKNGIFCQLFLFNGATMRSNKRILNSAVCYLLNRKLKFGFHFINGWLVDSYVFFMTGYYLTILFMYIANGAKYN